jgi:uncharacterized protein YjeT (DUF2065 family)
MLVLEGVLPFLNPRGWRQVFQRIIALSDGQIRFFGLASMAVGLVIVLAFS